MRNTFYTVPIKYLYYLDFLDPDFLDIIFVIMLDMIDFRKVQKLLSHDHEMPNSKCQIQTEYM